jgi:hypothetical protein
MGVASGEFKGPMDGFCLEGLATGIPTESLQGVGFEVVGNDPCVSDIEIEG